MDEVLIAPCGMNCAICLGYLRERNKCPGCRSRDTKTRISRLKCIIKNCETIKSNTSGFCYECSSYPCRRLKQLDKRYRTNYHMSMTENLEYLREHGVAALVAREAEKWRCPECGGVICCHNGICFNCGKDKLKAKRRKYRWEDD